MRCQPGILDNSAHRKCVHWVMPGDGNDSLAVGHDDVLPLPGDLESSPLQGLNSAQVGDSGNLRHVLRRNFHFPQVLLAG